MERNSAPLGTRTGPAGGAGSDPDLVTQTTNVVMPRDRVRWGPVWAGLLSALSLWLLGNVLAIAIGATTVDAGANAGDTARITGIVPAILGLLAFLFGGWVAARTAAVRGRGNGVFNGFLVWALGTLLALALAAFGLGQLLGAAGNFADQFGRLGRDAASNVDAAEVVRNRQAIVEGIKNSAWGTFAALGLPALAACIGGWLGSRHDRDDRTTTAL
ncbi:MAG: hypothetical protein M3281_05880 [Chloroflexota bacterium]|nr:hypothetical protein [Chloroflexota bacterium]